MKKIDWQSSTAHSQAGIQIQRLKDQIKKNGIQYVFFQTQCQVNFLMTRHLDGKTFVIFSLMPKFFLFISKLLIFFLYFIFVFWKTL